MYWLKDLCSTIGKVAYKCLRANSLHGWHFIQYKCSKLSCTWKLWEQDKHDEHFLLRCSATNQTRTIAVCIKYCRIRGKWLRPHILEAPLVVQGRTIHSTLHVLNIHTHTRKYWSFKDMLQRCVSIKICQLSSAQHSPGWVHPRQGGPRQYICICKGSTRQIC